MYLYSIPAEINPHPSVMTLPVDDLMSSTTMISSGRRSQHSTTGEKPSLSLALALSALFASCIIWYYVIYYALHGIIL